MALILIVAGALCEVVATIMGFHWFGTTGEDFPGWLAAGLVLYMVSAVVGATGPFVVRRHE